MYFFGGKLGAYERLMTEKPGFYRKDNKDEIYDLQKKSRPLKEKQESKYKESVCGLAFKGGRNGS